MSNAILNLEDLPGSGPAQPETFVNALSGKLAEAVAGQITIDFASDADYTLVTDAAFPENDEWHYRTIRMTDTGTVLTGAVDVIYPDVDTIFSTTSRSMFMFVNDTAQSLTILRSGQTGVTVTAGNAALVYHNGTDIVAVVSPI